MRFLECYLLCAIVPVMYVLTVLSSEALSSWLSGQQEKNEQETAAYVRSSFQGIVEYLFIYVCMYVFSPCLTLRRISGKEIWCEKEEAESLGEGPGRGVGGKNGPGKQMG